MCSMKYIIASLFYITILLNSNVAFIDYYSHDEQDSFLWSYKWIFDLNRNFNYSMRGKLAYLYYIRHMNNKSETCKYEFSGSYYLWLQAVGKVNEEGSSGELRIDVRSFWLNFDGYFIARKDTYYDLILGRSREYYKITEIYFRIIAVREINISTESILNIRDRSIARRYFLNGFFEIYLYLNFEKGVPYIPLDVGNYTLHSSTYYNYTIDIKSSFNISFKEFSSSSSKKKVDFERRYKGVSYLYSIMRVYEDTEVIVERPSIITNSGKNIMYLLFKSEDLESIDLKYYPNIDYYLTSIFESSTAKYNKSSQYYDSEKICDIYYFCGNFYGHESEKSSKEEVERVRKDADEVYGKYPWAKDESLNPFIISITLILIIFLLIISIIALLIFRKRDNFLRILIRR